MMRLSSSLSRPEQVLPKGDTSMSALGQGPACAFWMSGNRKKHSMRLAQFSCLSCNGSALTQDTLKLLRFITAFKPINELSLIVKGLWERCPTTLQKCLGHPSAMGAPQLFARREKPDTSWDKKGNQTESPRVRRERSSGRGLPPLLTALSSTLLELCDD